MTLVEIQSMTIKEAIPIVVNLAHQTNPDTEEGAALRLLLRSYRERGEALTDVGNRSLLMADSLKAAMPPETS